MPMQPSRRSFTKKPTSKKAPLGKVSIFPERLKERLKQMSPEQLKKWSDDASEYLFSELIKKNNKDRGK